MSARDYFIDMAGVLVSGKTMIPGSDEFLTPCRQRGVEFLVLTDNPIYTPRDLSHRLELMDPEMRGKRISASAMPTDVIARVESGMETVLVLTGVTPREDVAQHAYQPTRIVASIPEVDP